MWRAGGALWLAAGVVGGGSVEAIWIVADLLLAGLLSALGMLALGTAVARGGVWRGASRFGPLVMGLYPFVVMFPLVAANGGQPSVGGIAGWCLAAVVLGVAVLAQDSTVPVGQRPTPMANPIRTV